MEKIPAACAMEWSIELEKGLRSKNPGQRIMAIEQIGPKLQQWSMESNISMGVSRMYELVPGEDRTFANTIILRLADAFRYGDNNTRSCILKVFLLEMRNLFKKGKRYNGILAKQRVPNYVELLKRVKIVYDTRDREAKVLALRLFGCWADLAKDSAQIQYAILASLHAPHASEVKAALFAAGCLCRLSEDFACIILKVLVNLLSSSGVPADVMVTAVRAFSNLQCTASIIWRAYKAGKRLVLGSLNAEFRADMLSSLSKLAVKSIILVAEQVDLLLSVLKDKSASPQKDRALKCLYFLFSGGACHFPVNKDVCNALFSIMKDENLPLNFHCRALMILQKIYGTILPNLPYVDVPDLPRLILMVESTMHSRARLRTRLALHLLVDILCSLRRPWEEHLSAPTSEWGPTVFQLQGISESTALGSDKNDPLLLACRVTTLAIDQNISLVEQLMIESNEEEVNMEIRDSCGDLNKEYKALFGLIWKLAEYYPSSAIAAVSKIRCLIQTLGSMHDRFGIQSPGIIKNECGSLCREASQMEVDVNKPNPVSRSEESHHKKQSFAVSELIISTCRFANACLNILNDIGVVNCYPVVKLLIECIQQTTSYYWDTYEIFCLRMHSLIAYNSRRITSDSQQDLDESNLHPISGFFHPGFWVVQELHALEFSKKMVRKRNYWIAYRAGKYSCCEGLWFTATFVFRKLVDVVLSNSFSCWFKSLMLFAGGESEIKLLLFPRAGIELINKLQREDDSEKELSCAEIDKRCNFDSNADLHDCEGKLASVCSRICLSEETLASSGASDGVYYFQRWFITLRVKFLNILMEMIGLVLNRGEENVRFHFLTDRKYTHTIVLGLANISSRFNMLAKDYDLLTTSFPDIDHRSFRSISRLALNCSLLAFCTAFALDFSLSPTFETVMPCSTRKKLSGLPVLQDLLERLWGIDSTTAVQVQQFMTIYSEQMEFFQSRPQVNCSGHMERDFVLVCQFAIPGLICIREDSKGVTDEEDLQSLYNRGLQLLSDTMVKLMELPFQVPRYFFRVRPCIGAELFVFDTDSRNKSEISISPGFQLSLSLCIQLKNVLASFSIRVTKLYCILAAKRSCCLTTEAGKRDDGQHLGDFQFHESEEMVELNAMLLRHIKADTGKTSAVGVENGYVDFVTTCVQFEVNEKLQGFSACLLNVSAFPEGSYQIKWHSCCIDANGNCWSLLPLNTGAAFSIRKTSL
ncbi:uncharacterized protein [Typha angustifolia]|uniref:uncharacterized protein isoform X3 n=1 Tax=Typha angustifolia TaxID=59011 RepID=UPI003C2FEEA3